MSSISGKLRALAARTAALKPKDGAVVVTLSIPSDKATAMEAGGSICVTVFGRNVSGVVVRVREVGAGVRTAVVTKLDAQSSALWKRWFGRISNPDVCDMTSVSTNIVN